MVATRRQILMLKIHQIQFQLGLRNRPNWESF